MYDIKNLTNEVQYLFFRSGKDCFLAGKASLKGVRDSEITPVIKKMKQRKIIHLHPVTGAPKAGSRDAASSSQKPDEADAKKEADRTEEKTDTEKKAVTKDEIVTEKKVATKEDADTEEKVKTKSTTRGKK